MSANEIPNRIHFMLVLNATTGAYGSSVGVSGVVPGAFPGSWEIQLQEPLYLLVQDLPFPQLGANLQVTALEHATPLPLLPLAIPFPPSSALAPVAANVVVGFVDSAGNFTQGGVWHVIGFRYPSNF